MAASRLAAFSGRLDALSPLRTLKRGYAIVTRAEGGPPLRSASSCFPGDLLAIRFASGSAAVRVEEVQPEAVDSAKRTGTPEKT